MAEGAKVHEINVNSPGYPKYCINCHPQPPDNLIQPGLIDDQRRRNHYQMHPGGDGGRVNRGEAEIDSILYVRYLCRFRSLQSMVLYIH